MRGWVVCVFAQLSDKNSLIWGKCNGSLDGIWQAERTKQQAKAAVAGEKFTVDKRACV